MPRRNRRRPSNERTDFTKLADELRDEYAVRTGRTSWQQLKAERRASQSVRPRRTTLDEARALLGL